MYNPVLKLKAIFYKILLNDKDIIQASKVKQINSKGVEHNPGDNICRVIMKCHKERVEKERCLNNGNVPVY